MEENDELITGYPQYSRPKTISQREIKKIECVAFWWTPYDASAIENLDILGTES